MTFSSPWGCSLKTGFSAPALKNLLYFSHFFTECALLALNRCSASVERWQAIYRCHLECARFYKSSLISGHLTGTGRNVLAASQDVSQGVDSPEVCPCWKICLWLFWILALVAFLDQCEV